MEKIKRIFSLILVLALMVSMFPAVYAAEITEENPLLDEATEEIETEEGLENSAESPLPTTLANIEVTEPTNPTESTVPSEELNEEPLLNQALLDSGFVTDQLQRKQVGIEDPGDYGISTFRLQKTATLRNCDQMDFVCKDGKRQGFHYADEDGKAPWDYMNMIYCLENDKSFSVGSGHAGVGELPIDGSGTTQGEKVWYTLSADQRVAIGLILLYGAPTKLWDESWGFNEAGNRNSHNPNIGYRYATQALIWEITCNMREATPPYKRTSTYWYDNALGQCMSEDGKTDHFLVAYNSIISDMQMHNVIPSFAGDFAASAPEIQLAGNSVTVTDTNKVLSKFNFTNGNGVSYSKNGNNLTISVSGAVPTSVQTATATLPDPEASLYEVWYNQYDSSKQTCIQVSVPASDPVPAYFKLKASTGSLSLKKTTEDNQNLAGWIFNIYGDAACTQLISGPHTTDSGGNISATGLAAGDVWVKEMGHNDTVINAKYYCDSTNPQKVTIVSGQTASVSFNNKLNMGTAKIIKTATNGGSVAGWHFTVKDANGNTVGNYETDSTGIISISLLPGVYSVTETDGVYKYWANDPNPTKTVTVKANETSTVTFTNQWRGQVQIVKTATNGGSVEGWHFTIKDSSGNVVGNYVSDATGIITVDLEPGSYTVVETDGSYPYWHNDPNPTKTVTVKAGETAKVTFQNQWIGKAKIVKTLANPEAGTVEGWTFTISRVVDAAGDMQAEYIKTVTTGADGTILYDLEPGQYLITEELEENSLWQCITSKSQIITVVAGETSEVTFTNALRPGEISVEKVDIFGTPLAGAKFELQWSEDGTTWNPVFYSDSAVVVKGGCSNPNVVDGTLITAETGVITWGNLYPNLQYRILELEAPEGFMLLKDPAYKGKLPVDDLVIGLRVVNNRIFTLPETGSKSLALMPIGLLLCAAVCMGALFVLKKKKEV